MQLSTIVSVLAALGAGVTAAPTEGGGIEARAINEVPLLQLHNIPGMGGATFTGSGVPSTCYELPRNIHDFGRAEATRGFRCSIYTEGRCRGSSLTVGGRQAPAPAAFRAPVWRSWRCVCAHC